MKTNSSRALPAKPPYRPAAAAGRVERDPEVVMPCCGATRILWLAEGDTREVRCTCGATWVATWVEGAVRITPTQRPPFVNSSPTPLT